MSAINFPLATTSLFVNTLTTNKIIYLPAASTVGAGRLFYIKDICGNAAASSIYISTVGMDRLENRFQPSTLYALMSTNYGSILMAPDGALNWYFLQHYHRNAISSLGATAVVVGGGATSLTVLPDVRYSFLSTNYSSGSVNNIGTASATYGAASISGGTYTSASPGFMTFTWGTGYIQAPSVTSIKTIIMIVRLTNTNTWSYLLDARGGLGSGYWASEIGPDWLNNSTYYRDSVQRAYVNGTSYQELNDNIWHHICLVYPTGFTDDITFLARFTQNETPGGSCAEIMEFTVALTQQQIKDNFNFFASRFGWTPVY